MSQSVSLPRNSNQALGIGQFAVDFIAGSLGTGPSPKVLERTRWFHTDSVLCGLSALALQTNAPTILRNEALEYRVSDPRKGAFVFGSNQQVWAEKAVAANSSAVREWDSNGTNFGYRPELGHTAGEFGHNDFYPVVIAACQQAELDGAAALRAMVLLDEIRGRLAEVFSLKTYKIDHVVHGAIASAATYGALLGATPEQIESAIGMFVAHAIPWRAIRAGKQLSDSKGASAAISTEAAVLFMKRAMSGFVGPKDIFRNPEAIFRFFEPTTSGAERWKEQGDSPFEVVLSHSGDDFAIMGMHFKLGLYEHQSAGALQALIDMLAAHPDLLANQGQAIERITIVAYEPAFGIIGNPMKKNPTTRQSADHSMAYIVATLLRKAIEAGSVSSKGDEVWKQLMLSPYDYKVDDTAVYHPMTRKLMDIIDFQHGGPEYDAKYPEGIPTSLRVQAGGRELDSGLVMFPAGHARNTSADLRGILDHKFEVLGALAVPDGGDTRALVEKLESIEILDAYELASLYDVEVAAREGVD
ncbi:MAG: MmgE/PrpD family protein [Armatimonadetes bacterium]|nr:MmgE/PrpD family protein [Armatimonadota bacterium]